MPVQQHQCPVAEASEAKEGLDVDGLDALLAAATRLRELDPERFQRVLSLCRTYVSIYERPEESEEIFRSRLAQISPSERSKASA